MLLASITGCESASPAPATTTSETPAASSGTSGGGATYPIPGNVKITHWLEMPTNVVAIAKSFNEIPFAAELKKRTGVNVEFLHPPVGQTKETFSLLLASGDLPDVVETQWLRYFPGGPELGIKNNMILKLNNSMAELAPAFTAYLKANPNVDRLAKTDSGSYWSFPFIRGHEDLMVFYGPMMRGDWLEELGLEAPETIDEWTNVLTQFKEKKGATTGLTAVNKDFNIFNFDFLTGAWGVSRDFYLEDGKVVYGPSQPAFKDFIKKMNEWYNAGLLDPNFNTADRKAADALLTNGKSSAVAGYAGSGMGAWNPVLKETNPKAKLVGVKYPVVNKGEVAKLGQKDAPIIFDSFFATVNPKSKNLEAAIKYLDYGYTEEGSLLFNFGIEGVSYDMKDGYPTYKEDILKPKDGKSVGQTMAQYMRSNANGPFVQRVEYFEQYMTLQEQKDAVRLWKQTENEKNALPPVTATEDESKEFNSIKTNLESWRNEWVINAITDKTGKTVEKFDSEFVVELKKLGVDKATEIMQGAYERFKKR